MSTDKFNKIVALCLLTLIAAVSVLGFGLEASDLHVSRNIDLKGTSTQADFFEQAVLIPFNNPLTVNQDLKQFIVIEPTVDFSASWVQERLSIVFNQSLQPQTNYTLTIKAGLQDVYGKQLIQDFSYQFTTKVQQLAYLVPGAQQDAIKIGQPQDLLNAKQVFAAQSIQRFDLSNQYLAVVTQSSSNRQQLQVIKLDSDDSYQVSGEDYRITSLDYAPNQESILFVRQPVKFESNIPIPQAASQIMLFNPITRELKQVELAFSLEDISAATFAGQADAILLKDASGNYFVVDLNDTNNYAPIGRHIDASAFSFGKDQVILTDLPPVANADAIYPLVQIYNRQRETKPLGDSTKFIIDAAFVAGDQQVIYSKQAQALDGSRGRFGVYMQDLQTGQERLLVADDAYSYELAKPDFSGRFLAIEAYSVGQLNIYEDMRSFGFQAKPGTARLVLYDLQENKLTDPGLTAIDAIWLK